MVGKERMRPWPLVRASALCSLSALTLVVGWQEEHPSAGKNINPLIPRCSLPEQVEEEPKRTISGTGLCGKTAVQYSLATEH